MSLWDESLFLCLHDCGASLKERAKCIVAHLSMHVPRSCWERALKTGNVPVTHAIILKDLERELINAPDLIEQHSSSLLIALMFTDQIEKEELPGFSSVSQKHLLNYFLTKARKVLAERPELTQLGRLIGEMEI